MDCLRVRIACIRCAPLLVALLSGCSYTSPEELFARAQMYANEKNYPAAVVDLKSLLQDDPENIKARWLLATVYVDVEDWDSAEKELRRVREMGVADDSVVPLLARALMYQGDADGVLALATDGSLSASSNAEITATRGLAELAKKEDEKARMLIDTALSSAPGSPWVRLAEAQFLAAQGDFEGAKLAIENVHERGSFSGLAWSLLGNIHAQLGEFEAAEAAYSKAVDHRVVVGRERIGRGMIRLAQNNLAGAAEDANVVQQKAMNAHGAGYFVGLVRYRQERYEEAANVLEKAISIGDDDALTQFLLASTQSRLGNDERALQFAERVFAQAPQVVPVRKFLAAIYSRLGRPAEAEKLLRPIVNQLPDDLQAKDALAVSLVAQGKIDEAASLLEQIATVQKDKPQAQLRAGLGLRASGRGEEALAALGRASELAPDSPSVNVALVTSLIEAGESSGALQTAKRFAELNSDNPAAWGLLGQAFLAAEQPNEAEKAFRRTLKLLPGDPGASLGLATLAQEQGNNDAARTYLENAIASSPDNAKLLYRLAEIEIHESQLAAGAALLDRAMQAAPGWLAPRVALARLLMFQDKTASALDILSGTPSEQDSEVLRTRAIADLRVQRFADAKLVLEELRRRAPDDARVHYSLAQVYAELGDRDALAASLDRVLQLFPGDPRVSMAKASLLAMDNQFAEASNLLDTLDLPQDDPALMATRFFIARTEGDMSGSLLLARQIFSAQPSSRHLSDLVRLLVRNGELAEAESLLTVWIEQHPDDIAALNTLYEIYLRSGRRDEAIATLRQAVDKAPENVAAQNNLAWQLRETNPLEAMAIAENVYQLAPQSVAVLDTYAEILALNGKKQRAIDTIDRAISIAGGQTATSLQLRRAEILYMSGDDAQAIEGVETLTASGLPPALQQRALALLAKWQGG